MQKLLPSLITMSILCAASFAHSASIDTLYNTGVNASGSTLANGTIGDPHYSLISTPTGSASTIRVLTSAGGYPIGPWLGNNSTSTWIGPNNDSASDGPAGTYTYRTDFNLAYFNPVTAQISGQWSTDNPGIDIVLNGHSLGLSNSNQFASWTPFKISSFFVPGINTLDFIINNSGGPTGLRVEMSGTASSVPVPASAWLFGSGLIGLVSLLRRKMPYF